MRPGKASARRKPFLHTLILSLSLIVVWQAAAHAATTVTFGDNSGDNYLGTVEDALVVEEVALRDNNYGGREDFHVGKASYARRSFIRFTGLDAYLPTGVVITSAKMYLYCSAENSTTDYSISAYRVLLNWGEGSSNGSMETGAVCTNDAQYDGIIPWHSIGCGTGSDTTGEDSTADRTASAEASRLITGTGWFAWDLTTAAQNWYNGTWSEYGLVLIGEAESTVNSVKVFYSSESAENDKRPYLEVTYETALPGSSCSYTSSAHGDTVYGVNRTDAGYDVSDCAQCHDTFDPSTCGANQRMLFAPYNPASQSENFCFQCHTTTDSVQDGGITNYDYSETFGGAIDYLILGPDGIFEAFNDSVSYHNLSDVLNFAKGHWGTTFADESNACSACHNVHIARRNKAYKNNPLYTAVSRPSAHNQLHGDDAGERMSAYSDYYVSPHWRYSNNHEPANNSLQDGSNLPDFVTFCLDCHTKAIWSTTLGRNLRAIDWDTVGGETGGDKHGWNIATLGRQVLDPPYDTEWTQANGLVLCCTDCHEPHGSTDSVMLIRRKVNQSDMYPIDPYDIWGWGPTWDGLCDCCHQANAMPDMREIHHDGSDAAYPLGADPPHCSNCHYYTTAVYPIACTECHFHGGDDRWLDSKLPGWATYRRTF